MTFTRAALIASAVLLAGCGKVADLKPAAGQSLPVKPLMAKTTPTPAQLLTPPAYAPPASPPARLNAVRTGMTRSDGNESFGLASGQ